MSKQDQQIYNLLEKLFDAKLEPILADIREIKALMPRVESLEDTRTKLYTFITFIVLSLTIAGIYIRGFIEDVYRHVYLR